ncbi:MAG TPA: YdcF family protein [Candidatus Tenderia electrophaga]|uniref:YdcF family protein n=1 Tax=Candidatus Tenderia electrophaga TaxID=1748243 RepID=A0A832J5J3_9GAMM|nr:YdcF family protein [Candidatus Tenderia electrophaga]
MFELYLTNFIKSMVLPPGSLLLLLLLGLLLFKSRPEMAKGLLWSTFVLAYLFCTPLVSGLLLQQTQTFAALTETQIKQASAQAIVILSAGRYKHAPEYGGDTVGNNTLARLRYGAYLHRQTALPVLVSGGHVLDRQGDSLARVMANSLADDFHIKNVWLEDKSRTTAENARLSQKLLAEKDIKAIFLVTHASHMPRAVTIFEQQGLKVVAAPTRFYTMPDNWFLLLLPNAAAMADSYVGLHELLGQLWYKLRY